CLIFAALAASRIAFAGGTQWAWDITGPVLVGGTSTFSACESVNKVYLSGNYTRSASGLLDLVPNGCQICSDAASAEGCTRSNTGACSGIPSDIYAIEVPGVHTIVQPILTSPAETQPTYLVSYGNCPTHNMTSNFVFSQWSPFNDMTSSGQIAVGTFS